MSHPIDGETASLIADGLRWRRDGSRLREQLVEAKRTLAGAEFALQVCWRDLKEWHQFAAYNARGVFCGETLPLPDPPQRPTEAGMNKTDQNIAVVEETLALIHRRQEAIEATLAAAPAGPADRPDDEEVLPCLPGEDHDWVLYGDPNALDHRGMPPVRCGRCGSGYPGSGEHAVHAARPADRPAPPPGEGAMTGDVWVVDRWEGRPGLIVLAHEEAGFVRHVWRPGDRVIVVPAKPQPKGGST